MSDQGGRRGAGRRSIALQGALQRRGRPRSATARSAAGGRQGRARRGRARRGRGRQARAGGSARGSRRQATLRLRFGSRHAAAQETDGGHQQRLRDPGEARLVSVCGRECECVCECECVNGGDGVGPGRPPHRLQLGGAPPPLCSPSPSPRLSPSLPASPSVAGALSQRWCWRRSGALRTLSPSSASPRRPFEARRPWWRTRSRCSAGSATPTSWLWRMSTRALPTSTWPWSW
uniref:Pregnancy up-regulated nonubiquitous CaM kinase n=1 Tax=Sus scrofa TaxID=9823 RepID=A0A8D1XU21_PIG